MSGAAYRIIDEPQPGALAQIAVNPFWPLLAFMLGGLWCAWPWFVINAFALGSPTRVRDTGFAVAGFVGIFAIAFLMGWLMLKGVVGADRVKYAMMVVTLWKLGISYWLYELQSRSFGLYQYFGGVVRSGLAVVVLAAFAKSGVLGLSSSGLWKLLVS